jgi:hypothetical protein
MIGVTATLTSKSAKTVIVDGGVTFGDVLAGKTVASSDTFAIRQDRSVTFNPANLVWEIRGDSPRVVTFIGSNGGEASLPNFGTIIFSPGAFPTVQVVELSITASPETDNDFSVTGVIFAAGNRLPYELRVNSIEVSPQLCWGTPSV